MPKFGLLRKGENRRVVRDERVAVPDAPPLRADLAGMHPAGLHVHRDDDPEHPDEGRVVVVARPPRLLRRRRTCASTARASHHATAAAPITATRNTRSKSHSPYGCRRGSVNSSAVCGMWPTVRPPRSASRQNLRRYSRASNPITSSWNQRKKPAQPASMPRGPLADLPRAGRMPRLNDSTI